MGLHKTKRYSTKSPMGRLRNLQDEMAEFKKEVAAERKAVKAFELNMRIALRTVAKLQDRNVVLKSRNRRLKAELRKMVESAGVEADG